MTIKHSTELMKNQKNSVTMPADVQFDVLQTQEGNSLFFSIGGDNVFYLTRETQADEHGWTRLDMSTALSVNHGNAAVTAKSFDIAQDLVGGTTDVILTINANGQDHLYASLGNQNADAAWGKGTLNWTLLAFNDTVSGIDYSQNAMSDVYLGQTGTAQYIIADINKGDSLNSIARYFVEAPGASNNNTAVWYPHDPSGNLQAGSITTAMGRNATDTIDAVYTIGSLQSATQIFYTPVYNKRNKKVAPNAVSFNLPDSGSKNMPLMALSRANGSSTDIFVISNGNLYFLAAANQANGADMTLVFSDPLLQGATSLHVDNDTHNGTVTLWGKTLQTLEDGSSQSVVFVMDCKAGSETLQATASGNGTAWNSPVPLLFDVVNIASFAKNQVGNSVIFAHLNDGQESLVQMSQDLTSTIWHQRDILLPAPITVDTPYETTTYTTHIVVYDEFQSPLPNTQVAITATAVCSVYIDNIYYTLDTVNPVTVTTDSRGSLNIMQPIDTLGGVCYRVVAGDAAEDINPLTPIVNNCNNPNLDATVKDEYGVETPLVNNTVNGDQKTSTTTNINLLVSYNAAMPANGSCLPDPVTLTQGVVSVNNLRGHRAKFDPAKDKIHGFRFGKDAKHFEGLDALKEIGVSLHTEGYLVFADPKDALGSIFKTLEAKAGHMYQWMKKEVNKLVTAVIQLSEEVNHVFLQIAGTVYHFVMKCTNDIINTLHTVLNAIQVAFEDVVKWIGMIFSFQDILRTHNVIKSMINVYIQHTVDNFSSLGDSISTAFTELRKEVDTATGLPTEGLPAVTSSYNDGMKNGTAPAGSDSASANYGHHHVKSNGSSSDVTYSSTDNTPDDSIFADLLKAITDEGDKLSDAGNAIQAIAAKIKTQPISDTIAQVMAVIVDLLLETAEAILVEAVAVMKTLLNAAQDVLNAKIPIPVLNYFYKKLTKSDDFPDGQDLTPLDLACLLGAIPATVIYKAVKGVAPFPEGPLTAAIIEAKDMASLQLAMANFEAGSGTPAVEALRATGGDDPTGKTTINIISSICAAFGAVLIDLSLIFRAIIPWVPEGSGVDPLPANVKKGRVWSTIAAVSYMLYVLPDIVSAVETVEDTLGNPWYVNLNNACTGLGVGKAILDGAAIIWFGDFYGRFISPGLDFLINTAWQVGTTKLFVVQRDDDPKESNFNNCMELIGGTAFDASGILSPVYSLCYYQPSTPLRDGALGVTVAVLSVCNLAWAFCTLYATFDNFPVPTVPTNPVISIAS